MRCKRVYSVSTVFKTVLISSRMGSHCPWMHSFLAKHSASAAQVLTHCPSVSQCKLPLHVPQLPTQPLSPQYLLSQSGVQTTTWLITSEPGATNNKGSPTSF